MIGDMKLRLVVLYFNRYTPSGLESTSEISVASEELCVARGRERVLIVKQTYNMCSYWEPR